MHAHGDDSELIESIEVRYVEDENIFIFIINDNKEYSITPANYTRFVNASIRAINEVMMEHFGSSMRRFLKKPKGSGYKTTSDEIERWLKDQQHNNDTAC